jgi:hypothetical protein
MASNQKLRPLKPPTQIRCSVPKCKLPRIKISNLEQLRVNSLQHDQSLPDREAAQPRIFHFFRTRATSRLLRCHIRGSSMIGGLRCALPIRSLISGCDEASTNTFDLGPSPQPTHPGTIYPEALVPNEAQPPANTRADSPDSGRVDFLEGDRTRPQPACQQDTNVGSSLLPFVCSVQRTRYRAPTNSALSRQLVEQISTWAFRHWRRLQIR